VRVGTWGTDVTMSQQTASIRQNLVLVVDPSTLPKQRLLPPEMVTRAHPYDAPSTRHFHADHAGRAVHARV
jgi:hypothetical protein